jgi:tRNA (guanosine-2'-O-)-methyltransferase
MDHSSDPDAAAEMNELLAAAQRPADTDDPFVIDGHALAPEQVVDILQPVMRAERLARIRTIVAQRTNTVVPVVEGLVNTGNVSAVMRSAEALGYQSFHVVRGEHDRFKHSERTSRGAEKWLDLYRWPAPAPCVRYLHAAGYRTVAMHLAEDGMPISEIDFTAPTALVFGNEKQGVSPAMLEAVDTSCIVPLSGFTESFNVSVAAAVALYHAQQDRLARQGYHADLTDEEQQALVARFCMRSVRNAEAVLRRSIES